MHLRSIFLLYFVLPQVKYSNDHRSIAVSLKETAPGGARTAKVGLPYDPDLLDHLVIFQTLLELCTM